MPHHANLGRKQPSGDGVVRRASIACMACRARRVRCDGDNKHGAPCRHCLVTRTTCRYPRDDGRKRARVDLIKLQERIERLERAGWSNLVLPKTHEDRSSTPKNISPSITSENLVTQQFHTQMRNKDHSVTGLSMRIPGRDSSHHFLNLRPSSSAYFSMDQNGKLRFFGYTSNMQVIPIIQPALSESSPESTSSMMSSDAGEKLADSLDFQAHLVDLYFTYQDPALPLVQMNVFMEDWSKGKRSQYFSNFLLYAILARSVRLSDWPDALSTTPVYHRRAKAEILDELDDPVLATIQGLCIYGHFLASIGNERGCWLYPGMAFRLTYDFGLHQDSLQLVQKGSISERDRQSRISALWGCYIADKLYSICQGRPSAIRLEELSLPRPSKDTVGTQHQLLAAFTDFSIILERVGSVLNGKSELLEQETSLNALSDAADELLLWLKSLPPELLWHPPNCPPPGTCALHLLLLTTVTLVHRPFADYDESAAEIKTSKPLPGYTRAESRSICTQNSMRISKLIDIFKQTYGMQKLFAMGTYVAFTAAMSLGSEMSGRAAPEEVSKNVLKALNLCLNALHDLGSNFPLARKHQSIVLSFLTYCGLQNHIDSDQFDLGAPGFPALKELSGSPVQTTIEEQPAELVDTTSFVEDPYLDEASWILAQSSETQPITAPMVNNSSSNPPSHFASTDRTDIMAMISKRQFPWDLEYLSQGSIAFQQEPYYAVTNKGATTTHSMSHPDPDHFSRLSPSFNGIPWTLDINMNI